MQIRENYFLQENEKNCIVYMRLTILRTDSYANFSDFMCSIIMRIHKRFSRV